MDLPLNEEAVTDIHEASLGWLAGIIALTILDQFQDDAIISLTFLAGYTAFYFLAAMIIWYVTPAQDTGTED
jgi:hypothetical protein